MRQFFKIMYALSLLFIAMAVRAKEKQGDVIIFHYNEYCITVVGQPATTAVMEPAPGGSGYYGIYLLNTAGIVPVAITVSEQDNYAVIKEQRRARKSMYSYGHRNKARDSLCKAAKQAAERASRSINK
ncbi:MAG: hypothetical protein LBK94_08610 [Prevotellaceae bacterium]|jgi:hypothetical protein|nr:hypothetical protein [Prevotellaceae bacterium]